MRLPSAENYPGRAAELKQTESQDWGGALRPFSELPNGAGICRWPSKPGINGMSGRKIRAECARKALSVKKNLSLNGRSSPPSGTDLNC